MYIGSTSVQTEPLWVLSADGRQMVWREASYVPGLYKIFDEILVNAADNKQRDASMDAIKVEIDREGGRISVWNNGRGIPVEEHKEHKCYVPELIFGAHRARRARRARPPAAPPPTRARRRAAQAPCSPGATSRTTRRR